LGCGVGARSIFASGSSLTLHGGSVKIHDLPGLRKLAAFQGRYLDARD
jgi:hypothetical protein